MGTHISARAVQFAVVIDVEVDDVNGTAAVVLDDFVRSMVGSTTDDPALLASSILLDGNSIFADILKPAIYLVSQVSRWIYCSIHPMISLRDTYTNSSVQWPLQWTPSAWFLPMITLRRVAPA